MEKIITREMVTKGYNQHLINLSLSPHGDGIVCQIGDNWFYFGGSMAEAFDDIWKYKEEVYEEDIIADIYTVLCEFKTEFEDEYLYYYYYLMENLKDDTADKYDIAKEVRIEDFKNAMECMDFSPDDYTEKELAEMFDTFEDLLANDDTYNSIYSETLYYVLKKRGK